MYGGLACGQRVIAATAASTFGQAGLMRCGDVKAAGAVELVVVALSHEFHARGSAVVGSTTKLYINFTVISLCLDDITAVAGFTLGDGALVVNTCCATGINHVLDVGLVCIVVLDPNTGGAGHGKNHCICCTPVPGNSVVVATCVVVVNESNGIATVVGVASDTLVRQGSVVAVTYSVVDDVLQGEVKSC